jgi:phospho-N-acetylmuramoyl-pentapeptide-transferase
LSYVVGNAVICDFFRIPHVTDSGELTILCAAFVGTVMGFLWFNAHPARIFMGDTGSLALGAGLAYVALVTKHELVLIVAGGVFVLEALSVILQVLSFRWLGRRLFKCAPFHHHLQFCGWHENHVVVRTWMISAVLAALAVATLKMH